METARIGCLLEWLEMAGFAVIGCKYLETARNGWNGCKLLEAAGIGCKGHGWL